MAGFYLVTEICYNKNMRLGFTIIELLIVIGILAALALFSAPIFQNFNQSNDLQTAFNLIINKIISAQIKSQSVVDDSAWGVKIIGNEAVIFKGNNYIGRDPAFDEKASFSSNIAVNPLFEIVFNKLTGYPNFSFPNITITNGLNEAKIFSINEKGAVIY